MEANNKYDNFTFGQVTARLNANSETILNVASPVNNTDAANKAYVLSALGGSALATNYQTPTTGASIALQSSNEYLILNPTSTLATLSITFPSAPSDASKVTMVSTQAITALTLSGATFGSPAVSSLTANAPISYVYSATPTSWYRC